MGDVERKEFIAGLKDEWKTLWQRRIDDKVRAEGIADRDYSDLSVEKGTVIFATRDFKPLSFREILKQHKLGDVGRFVSPSPSVGGWGKFVRTVIAKQKRFSKRVKQSMLTRELEKKRQQLKKGGHGWVHL